MEHLSIHYACRRTLTLKYGTYLSTNVDPQYFLFILKHVLMRRILFLSITALLITSVGNEASGQSVAPKRGSFEMAAPAKGAAVKASYSVSTGNSDNLVLQLVPDQPFKLNARIVNGKGKVVSTIPAENVGLRYAQNI